MNMSQVIYIPVNLLSDFMTDVFIKCGVSEEDANISADVLISADMRGIESHGIGRLKMYVDRIKTGQIIPGTPLIIVRESPTTAVLDGNHNLGMVVSKKAMQIAIEKAITFGMGSVAVRNSSHFGIAGYYSLMAVKQGMIGLTFTNARPCIAPTFGTQPMLGTNPIAFAAPTDEDIPFIFDGATSIAQRGKVEIADREGHPLPEGLVIDPDGNPLTDPKQILSDLVAGTAAMLPLGGAGESGSGYKGYGLGTMVEILSASLQSGAFLYGLTGIDSNGGNSFFRSGHFFMAINIEAFTQVDDFKKTTGNILRELRNSRKMPGQNRIYTAGEKEYENEIRLKQTGIPIIPAIQSQMLAMQKEFRLNQYRFPF